MPEWLVLTAVNNTMDEFCLACVLEKVLDETAQTAVEPYSEVVPAVADFQLIVNANAELKLEWSIAQGVTSDLAFAIIETMHKYALNKGTLLV
jgi:hypothetical protein